MGNYPAYDAQQAFSGIGPALAQIAIGRARLNAQQQYQQAQMANMLELRRQEQERLALQQALYNAQIGHYTAQSGEATARAGEASARQAIEAARLANANSGGQAAADTLGMTQMNPLSLRANPESFNQTPIGPPTIGLRDLDTTGPSVAAANLMRSQDIARQAAAAMVRSQYLSQSGGNPLELVKAQNFQDARQALPMNPALAQAIMLGAKPIAIAQQGGVYNPVSGAIDPNAIMPQKVAPGSTMYPMTGGAPGTPVTAPGQPGKGIDWQHVYTSAAAAIPNLAPKGDVPAIDSPLYSPFTNTLALLAQSAREMRQSGTGTNVPPPNASPAQGPTRLLSQADYDALPSGSLYIDTDGSTKRKR